MNNIKLDLLIDIDKIENKDLQLLKKVYAEYYNVFEDLKELDEDTLELFNREEFDYRDIEDLKNIKKNIAILNNLIDKKISEIYTNQIGDDFWEK